MRYVSKIIAALFCVLLGASPAGSGSMTLLGAGKAASGAVAPTLDGSAVSSIGVSNTNTVTLTTTKTNDEVIVFVAINTCSGGTDSVAVTSINLTFTQRAKLTGAQCGGNDFQEWTAPSSGILTSEVITVTVTPGAGINYIEAMAFGVNGINTGTPFDANGSLPSIGNPAPLSISTNHAADFIFAGFRGGGPLTPDAGFTIIVNGGFLGCEFMRVTSTQSGLSLGGSNSGIGDAIVSP